MPGVKYDPEIHTYTHADVHAQIKTHTHTQLEHKAFRNNWIKTSSVMDVS